MAVQGASGGGGDSQGGRSGRGHPDPGHGAPRGPALHLAGRAQTHGAMWAPGQRQDNDPLQCPQGSTRHGGNLDNKIINLKAVTFICSPRIRH